MRSAGLLFAGLLISTSALAADRPPLPQTQVVPQKNEPASFSAGIAPPSEAAPAPGTGSTTNAPILQAITVRTAVSNGRGVIFDVVPDFHFIAPNGNAILVHRELIDTNGNLGRIRLNDGQITIPAAAQKKGAVQSGGWQCGIAQYYVTIRAVIMDADGNRSNPMEYTIHCNGG